MESLHLFSSARAIKDFYFSLGQERFLPDAQSLHEFIESILLIPNKTKIPAFLRPVFLHRAICCHAPLLGDFGKNFSDFLDHSSFFFSFYDELCVECVELSQLAKADIYAHFDDHLEVLEKIFQSYQKELHLHGFYDQIFLESYRFVGELLSHYSMIILHLEGFLSRFEFEVFQKISFERLVTFCLCIDAFNRDFYERMFQIRFGEYGHYEVLLEKALASIQRYTPKPKSNSIIWYFEGSEIIRVVGAIFAQIDQWLAKGVEPEQITIVLPTEEMQIYLELFDGARNFNYAMGRDLKRLDVQQALNKKIEQEMSFEELKLFVMEAQSHDLYDWQLRDWKQQISHALELLELSQEHLSALTHAQQCKIFASLLDGVSIDDNTGGRIQVLGLLETRGMSFDYLIIPEFNDGIVPKLSDKDIFLNTAIRKQVGLPTKYDRQNLQKHYYAELFSQAKEVLLLSINNDKTKPSKLLNDKLLLPNLRPIAQQAYEQYFITPQYFTPQTKQIQAPHHISELSATKLTCLLECKRKYYYQYIQKFAPNLEKEMVIGREIHQALKKLYESLGEQCLHLTSDELFGLFCQHFNHPCQSYDEVFQIDLAKAYMKKFFEHEREHFSQGWIPFAFEQPFGFSFGGLRLVGVIDRIDKRGDEWLILDYKFTKNLKVSTPKNYQKSTHFQLEMYALALEEQGFGKITTGFYDLYEGKILWNGLLEEKKALLVEQLMQLQTKELMDFEQCEKKETCLFCPYVYLCNRY